MLSLVNGLGVYGSSLLGIDWSGVISCCVMRMYR